MATAESLNSTAEGRARSVRLGWGRAAKWAIAAALVACVACARSIRNPFAPWSPPAPEVLAAGASRDLIIAAVNQNASRIQSLQTNDASITVPGMPGVPILRGNIAAQRPGRLRLQASTALTGPEVDLGSNDELFWFWVRRNEPPALYFGRHDQFAGSAAERMMPIEPQWLLDALGFTQFNPADFHEGPLALDKGRVEIRSVVQSRTGPVTKRTIIDARRAWVLEQHIYDRGGTLLASAVAHSHRYYPQAGVSLPQEIELRAPAAGLALTITMGTVQINSLADNPQLWTMPVIPGVQPVDVGTPAQGAGAPPLGDQLSRANWYGPAPGLAPPQFVTGAAMPAAPLLGASQTPGASPQFIAHGGVAIAPAAAQSSMDESTAARLPMGGAPAVSPLVR